MDYRTLGRTGVKVSEICYGTMSFGGDADEVTSEQMYRRVLSYAAKSHAKPLRSKLVI